MRPGVKKVLPEFVSFPYLVPGEVAEPLRDRRLHLAALLPQPVVLPAQVLLLLQQRHVAPRQLLLVDPEHRQLAQHLAQLPLGLVGAPLKGVEELLMAEEGALVETLISNQVGGQFEAQSQSE